MTHLKLNDGCHNGGLLQGEGCEPIPGWLAGRKAHQGIGGDPDAICIQKTRGALLNLPIAAVLMLQTHGDHAAARGVT